MTASDDPMAEGAPPPEAMLGDKGYDRDAIRGHVERRGIDPEISTQSNRKVQRITDKATYAMRSPIERVFNKIKHARRVATRCDKLASSFRGFVQLAAIRCWIRFVQTTQTVRPSFARAREELGIRNRPSAMRDAEPQRAIAPIALLTYGSPSRSQERGIFQLVVSI